VSNSPASLVHSPPFLRLRATFYFYFCIEIHPFLLIVEMTRHTIRSILYVLSKVRALPSGTSSTWWLSCPPKSACLFFLSLSTLDIVFTFHLGESPEFQEVKPWMRMDVAVGRRTPPGKFFWCWLPPHS